MVRHLAHRDGTAAVGLDQPRVAQRAAQLRPPVRGTVADQHRPLRRQEAPAKLRGCESGHVDDRHVALGPPFRLLSFSPPAVPAGIVLAGLAAALGFPSATAPPDRRIALVEFGLAGDNAALLAAPPQLLVPLGVAVRSGELQRRAARRRARREELPPPLASRQRLGCVAEERRLAEVGEQVGDGVPAAHQRCVGARVDELLHRTLHVRAVGDEPHKRRAEQLAAAERRGAQLGARVTLAAAASLQLVNVRAGLARAQQLPRDADGVDLGVGREVQQPVPGRRRHLRLCATGERHPTTKRLDVPAGAA